MKRRSFLLGSGIAGAGVATGAGFWRWQEVASSVNCPGRDIGHRLRDLKPSDWPAPSAEYKTDVAIVGSGIAGLTAAWRLAKEGHTRFALILGPEPHGNAASGAVLADGERLRYPTGAHYLPLPSMESAHVRTMLAEFGVLLDGASGATPTYDERVIVHAPDERLYHDGRWHEGLVPIYDASASDPPSRNRRGHAAAGSAIERFLRHVDELREARGADGRKVFAIPIVFVSSDPQWTALDAISFSAWLAREGYDDPALRWYLDYCCRDDYGANASQVSAWAGLHYFAARNGQAKNADRGAVLTWPEGLGALAMRLDASAFAQRGDTVAPLRLEGTALAIRETRGGVEVLCARLEGKHLSTYLVRARRAISAMPLFVAKHVVASLTSDGYDPAQHAPQVAPWLVANFIMNRHPEEADGAELAWDNVLYGSDGLGYVVSTHQQIRVAPSRSTVFTAYRALADVLPGRTPDDARRWMARAAPAEIGALAAAELRDVYGWRFAPCVDRVEITLRGHAMASPTPGTLANPGLRNLRASDGRILYAHADLSGYSVFEEAAWWGWRTAERVLG
ncbi:MAG: NAD(P)-binding protein [Burkholderiaceae bacterium]